MDRRRFLAAGAAGAALGVMGTGRAASGSWSAATAMPWPAQEIYAATTGSRILTAGGLVARQGQPLHIEQRVAILDTATGTWSEGPMLPQPRHHPMMVADGTGRMLAIGGYQDRLRRTPDGWRIYGRRGVKFGTGVGIGNVPEQMKPVFDGMGGRLSQWP